MQKATAFQQNLTNMKGVARLLFLFVNKNNHENNHENFKSVLQVAKICDIIILVIYFFSLCGGVK